MATSLETDRPKPPYLLGSDDDEVQSGSSRSPIDWEKVKGCLLIPILVLPAAVAAIEVIGEVVIDLARRLRSHVSRKTHR